MASPTPTSFASPMMAMDEALVVSISKRKAQWRVPNRSEDVSCSEEEEGSSAVSSRQVVALATADGSSGSERHRRRHQNLVVTVVCDRNRDKPPWLERDPRSEWWSKNEVKWLNPSSELEEIKALGLANGLSPFLLRGSVHSHPLMPIHSPISFYQQKRGFGPSRWASFPFATRNSHLHPPFIWAKALFQTAPPKLHSCTPVFGPRSKFYVAPLALWGANTFPTRNRLPNSNFGFLFHNKLWWRLQILFFKTVSFFGSSSSRRDFPVATAEGIEEGGEGQQLDEGVPADGERIKNVVGQAEEVDGEAVVSPDGLQQERIEAEEVVGDVGAMQMVTLAHLNGRVHLYVVHNVSEAEVIHMIEYNVDEGGEDVAPFGQQLDEGVPADGERIKDVVGQTGEVDGEAVVSPDGLQQERIEAEEVVGEAEEVAGIQVDEDDVQRTEAAEVELQTPSIEVNRAEEVYGIQVDRAEEVHGIEVQADSVEVDRVEACEVEVEADRIQPQDGEMDDVQKEGEMDKEDGLVDIDIECDVRESCSDLEVEVEPFLPESDSDMDEDGINDCSWFNDEWQSEELSSVENNIEIYYLELIENTFSYPLFVTI
ncbi:hypothetical protein V8G54_019950 [Vigna mungo]|uniref:Uncharacterized protein n=1 Tax=Vigna mungo TaxID=3915 RepID=A0AAQ3RVZ0_VIGMU